MATTAYVPAEALLAAYPEDARVEVVDGVVVPMSPTKNQHGLLAGRLFRRLGDYVEAHGLGETFPETTGFMLARNPDLLRAPDAAFVAADRLPAVFDNTWLELAPDLAAEVLSPSETASSVAKKVDEYLGHGARLVWVVDPQTRSVTVYTPDGAPRRLEERDTLDGGAVVPGFALALAELFARVARA
jgi:Uma2 family endonuclease